MRMMEHQLQCKSLGIDQTVCPYLNMCETPQQVCQSKELPLLSLQSRVSEGMAREQIN